MRTRRSPRPAAARKLHAPSRSVWRRCRPMPSVRPRLLGPCSARCARKRGPPQPLRPLHATRNASRPRRRLLPRRPSVLPSRRLPAWRPKRLPLQPARPRKRLTPRPRRVAAPRPRWPQSTACWKPAGVRRRPRRRRLLRLRSRHLLPVRPRTVVVARCIVRRASRPRLHRPRTPVVVAATSTSSPRSFRRPGRMTLPASAVRPRADATTAMRAAVLARVGARVVRVVAMTAIAVAALPRRSSPRRRSCVKFMCPRPSRWPIWPTRWP